MPSNLTRSCLPVEGRNPAQSSHPACSNKPGARKAAQLVSERIGPLSLNRFSPGWGFTLERYTPYPSSLFADSSGGREEPNSMAGLPIPDRYGLLC